MENRMKFHEELGYLSPDIEVVSVKIEQGVLAGSANTDQIDNLMDEVW